MKNWKEGETDVQACRVNRRRRDKKIFVHTSFFCICMCQLDAGRNWKRYCSWNCLLHPSSTTFPTFFPHFNQPTSTKTQVPTQIFFYFESRKFSTCLCIPDPDAFSKITWFSGKNGGHVLSRNSCWREWIPLPFSKKFNFLKEPTKNIYFF